MGSQLSERDDAEFSRCGPSSCVNMLGWPVFVIEILSRQTQSVVKNRIGEIRQLLSCFHQRVGPAYVMQINAQQLAAPKTR